MKSREVFLPSIWDGSDGGSHPLRHCSDKSDSAWETKGGQRVERGLSWDGQGALEGSDSCIVRVACLIADPTMQLGSFGGRYKVKKGKTQWNLPDGFYRTATTNIFHPQAQKRHFLNR